MGLTMDTEAERAEAHAELAAERWAAHREKHGAEKELAEAHWEAHEQEHRAIARSLADYKTQSNEWRGSLTDMRSTFAPLSQQESLEGEVNRRYEELRALIATEREERRAAEGIKRGMSQTTAILVGAIGLAATIISVVVVVANYASR